MHTAAIYEDTQAAVKKSKKSQKLNNSHFGEAAQTSHSPNLYMPTPGRKLNHDMSQIVTMSNTKMFLILTMAPAFL